MPLFPDPCCGIVALRHLGMPGYALDSGLIPEDEIAGRNTAQDRIGLSIVGWNYRGAPVSAGGACWPGLLVRPQKTLSATGLGSPCRHLWSTCQAGGVGTTTHGTETFGRVMRPTRDVALQLPPENIRPIFGCQFGAINRAIRHYTVAGFISVTGRVELKRQDSRSAMAPILILAEFLAFGSLKLDWRPRILCIALTSISMSQMSAGSPRWRAATVGLGVSSVCSPTFAPMCVSLTRSQPRQSTSDALFLIIFIRGFNLLLVASM